MGEQNIRLLFVCGSPRNASTLYAVQESIKAAEEQGGVQCTLLQLAKSKIAPCISCNACVKKNVRDCLIHHDDMNEWYQKFFDYDGVLIGSPVYSMGITPQLSAFFSRFRPEFLREKENPHVHAMMAGAALAVGGTRNGGEELTIGAIHGFYFTHGITVASGGLGVYGGAALWSRDLMVQGIKEDVVGVGNARRIGTQLAIVAKALSRGNRGS